MDRQQMIDEIKNNIGSYIQHGGAIEGGGWKVYDPISLSRVLSTLGLDISNGHIETHQYKDGSFQIFTDFSDEHMCVWKLLNEDNSDCMLDDQSDETIEALYKLLVRK